MISVLTKPMDQISPDDIQDLIDSEVPESEQIEFKESLPTEDGSTDPWQCGAERIGRAARKKIVEEAVAFANAYGGALVLGVRESEDDAKPGIAEEITAVPRCADLAKRLNLVFRDWVDPQIPRIEIFGVPTGDDGSGVVIIRTGRSRMAPHRVKPTRKCTIRRADRCEEMTMHEIQDLTLNLSRGTERLENQLKEREEIFQQEFDRLSRPDDAFGIRATAIPIGDEIGFERVYGRQSLYRPAFEISLFGTVSRIDAKDPSLWRPMLRSARAESGSYRKELRHSCYYELIQHEGLVECASFSCIEAIDPSHALTLFAATAIWSDHVRNEAGLPTIEYAIDVEVYSKGQGISVRVGSNYRRIAHMFSDEELGRIDQGRTSFPRYSLADQSEIPRIVELFERDFWNLIGKDISGTNLRLEQCEGTLRLVLESSDQS